ncbi:MAG: hypothetical protein EPN48_14950 [Microbacteriaceae bacterium]|nr:MAG: hypothetical protein EPN48_14950 [Microbacteriaceae bacterium]
MSSNLPASDPFIEAARLSALAAEQGLTVRLLGGVAVALRAGDALPAGLRRTYKDLDFVTTKKDAPKWAKVLEAAGYVSDTNFNTLHGSQRYLHFDTVNNKQLDTFIEEFAMCQVLSFKGRLPKNAQTLAPADLLLTKLQIVEVNDKDLVDTAALFLHHPVERGNQDAIDLDMIQSVLANHWGWYTTISDNLPKVAQRTHSLDLTEEQKVTVIERIDSLLSAIERFPKGLKWRARAVVGRKMPWYDLPEEVED